MSLVIANKTGDSIVFVSDTKITYRHDDLNPYLEGVGKISLLNEKQAVAFAGDLGDAKRALSRLRTDRSTNQVVASLSDLSAEKGFGASFIVASIDEGCHIYRIRDGRADDVPSAWIGDHNAFQLYQSYFIASEDPQHSVFHGITQFQLIQMPEECSPDTGSLYSRMFKALYAVIGSQSIKSVGGFLVPVIVHKRVFEYGSYFSLFRRPIAIEELDANKGVVPFGDASTGTFSVNASGIGHDHFVVHIAQGNVGIIFSKSESMLLAPELLTNVDEIDFATAIQSRCGGSLIVTMHHSSGHYFQKAEPHFRKRAFEIAERYLNEGVRYSSTTWKAGNKSRELQYESLSECREVHGLPLNMPVEEARNLTIGFYMRGICRFATGRITLALQDFRESLTLDEVYYHSMIWLVRAHRELGHLELAVAAAKRCCEKHERPEAFQLCGQLLLETNQHEEAIEYLRQGHNPAPDGTSTVE